MARYFLPNLVWIAGLAVLPAQSQDIRIQSTKGFVTVLRGDTDPPIIRGNDTALVTDDRIVTGPDAEAHVLVDQAHSLQIGAESEVRLGEIYPGRYQMVLVKGGLTWNVRLPSTAAAEVQSPSVGMWPRQPGAYGMAINLQGETEITAQDGRIEVFAGPGSQWLERGQTLVARGPFDDPEFRIAGKRSRWRRLLTLLSNVQVAGTVASAVSNNSSQARPRTSAFKQPSGHEPVRTPESGHPPATGHSHSTAPSPGHSTGTAAASHSAPASASSATHSAPAASSSSTSSSHSK
jgi:hypothetical protein